jgi:hypothetical protein
MELGGWSSYEMVLRYAHRASDQLLNAATAIDTEEEDAGDTETPLVTNRLRSNVIPLPKKHASKS